MTAPNAPDSGPPEARAPTPVWKEPPFLAGVVVLVGLAVAVGLLYVLERDGESPVGELEPTPRLTAPASPQTTSPPVASPTPSEPSPTASPAPSPTETPGDGPGPQAPRLPDEKEAEVVVGQGPDPVEATGRGAGRTPVIQHDAGLAIVHLGHAGEDTFRAELIDRRGVRVELDGAGVDGSALAITEGRYDGSRALVLDEGRYRVALTADGTWGMRWLQPRYEGAPGLPTTLSAPSDAATRPFTVAGSRVEIAWRVDGGQVTARVINVAGLVAAEVTASDGETTVVDGLGAGLYLLDVRADDRWHAEVR